MQIVHEQPPNFKEIVSVFPDAKRDGVMFTYGDKIYLPYGGTITPSLMAHEQIHSDRQLIIEPENWWQCYLQSKDFRYKEELLAHQAEYQCFAEVGRNQRRFAKKSIAKRLASPLYGRMITFEKAKLAIAA